jgi:hypothetical protein
VLGSGLSKKRGRKPILEEGFFQSESVGALAEDNGR